MLYLLLREHFVISLTLSRAHCKHSQIRNKTRQREPTRWEGVMLVHVQWFPCDVFIQYYERYEEILTFVTQSMDREWETYNKRTWRHLWSVSWSISVQTRRWMQLLEMISTQDECFLFFFFYRTEGEDGKCAKSEPNETIKHTVCQSDKDDTIKCFLIWHQHWWECCYKPLLTNKPVWWCDNIVVQVLLGRRKGKESGGRPGLLPCLKKKWILN